MAGIFAAYGCVADHDPGTLERECDNHEKALQELLDARVAEEDLNAAINNLGSIPLSFVSLDGVVVVAWQWR
jgi:hypothetical protein